MLVAFWDLVGLTRPWNPPHRDIRFAMRGQHSTILLGFDGDVLVGSAMVGDDGHRGWIYYVGSLPSRRGEGVGKAMVEAAEGWLKDRGVWKVQLLVRSDNMGVHDFYKHLGFEKTDVVMFQKWLDKP